MKISEQNDHTIIIMMQSDKFGLRRKALTHIYKQYFDFIRSQVVLNSGSVADAEDVFQEGVVVLYENILQGKFKEKSSILTYLRVICRNIWLKKLKNRLPSLDIQELYNSGYDVNSESDFNLAPESTQKVRKALNLLEEADKQILIEFYFNKRSMKELMKMFNLGSEQAAKNKKRRCLKKLISVLQDYGISKDYFFDEYSRASYIT